MASLSTTYAVTILLGSIAAIGAAFVGAMLSPITKPPVSLAPETVEEPAPAPPATPEAPPVESIVETSPAEASTTA
jgi:hypothetical protein